ncbi:hypothetical protein J2S43_003429 [Catenuloplanes nepalensis]|uniref:Uncharacterized protein n=1 Tax=Catenuloplanes nepalensis TaxID=587533 RepID=A0ABT9MTZ8_9ACTN|nr:hypothetical protein [Catenuloplanes nepalensis]
MHESLWPRRPQRRPPITAATNSLVLPAHLGGAGTLRVTGAFSITDRALPPVA